MSITDEMVERADKNACRADTLFYELFGKQDRLDILRAALTAAIGDGVVVPGWQPIETAPKDGTPFLAWCPIIMGLGDTDATPDAETRIVWWEDRGQFTSDRDLGNEQFTHLMPLPAAPQPGGDKP